MGCGVPAAPQSGFRESEQSWHELLVRPPDENGLVVDPELATGDGALGFWKMAKKVWPNNKPQRCWDHKTANVPNYLPRSLQKKAKADLHAIYQAESRAAAEVAFDRFLAKYRAKFDKAAGCLAKDREALLAFYASPAEHWQHIRGTNPVESTFATVRLRPPIPKAASRARPRSPWSSGSPSRAPLAPLERLRSTGRDRSRHPLPRRRAGHLCRGPSRCLP